MKKRRKAFQKELALKKNGSMASAAASASEELRKINGLATESWRG